MILRDHNDSASSGDTYVYSLQLESENQPFYIGVGKNYRYAEHFKNHTLVGKNSFNKLKSAKILDAQENNVKVLVNIIKKNLSREEAFALEKELVSKYGRLDLKTGCLTNLCEGGSGVSGLSHETLERAKSARSKELIKRWENRVYRDLKTKQAKQQWKNKEFRKTIKENLKERWNDPEKRIEMAPPFYLKKPVKTSSLTDTEQFMKYCVNVCAIEIKQFIIENGNPGRIKLMKIFGFTHVEICNRLIIALRSGFDPESDDHYLNWRKQQNVEYCKLMAFSNVCL